MRKVTTFTLNGKPLELKRSGTIAESIRRLLDKLPDGTLLTTNDIADKIGCSRSSTPPASQLPGYAVHVGPKILWGSKRTISQAEDAIGNND